ncbi:TPA: hypothetical protein ITS68_001393 [Enterococcus faecalis]|nr:hypothetical protein [Enterococcus faecalis]HAP3007297.1 hypothetical protein [Enterococcus faecalis]
MKKMTTVILVSLLIFSLSGCKGKDKDKSKPKQETIEKMLEQEQEVVTKEKTNPATITIVDETQSK